MKTGIIFLQLLLSVTCVESVVKTKERKLGSATTQFSSILSRIIDTNSKSDTCKLGISNIKKRKEHDSFLITPEEIQHLPLSFINSLSPEDHFLLFRVVAKEHNKGSNLLDDKFIILVNSLLKSPIIKDVVLFLVRDNREYMHNLHMKSSTKKRPKTPILTSLQLFKRLGGSDHMPRPMSAHERATARFKTSIHLQGHDYNRRRLKDPLPHLNLSPRFKTKGFIDLKFISALRAKAFNALDDGIDSMRESLCRSFCVTSELWTDMEEYYERENDSPTVFSNEARMDTSASTTKVTFASFTESETQLSVKKQSLSAERIEKGMKYVAGGATGGDDEMCPLDSVIRLHQKAPHHNINNIFEQEDGLTIEFLYDSDEEEEEEGIYRYQRVCSSLRSESSSEDDSVFTLYDKLSIITKKEKVGQISSSTRKLLQQTRKQLKETEAILEQPDRRQQSLARIKRLRDQLTTDGTKITYDGKYGHFKQQLAQQRLLIKEKINDVIDGHKELYFNVSYE